MAYYLQFDGSDDYVSLASAISVNWGTDAYVFEFTANIKTWPSSANAGIIGSITSSTTGITLRSFSPVNSLTVLSGGSPRYDSGADFIIIGEKHTYRLEHDANGDYRWLRDGVLFSSGNFTTSTPATVQAIGQARAPGLWAHMDLYRLTFVSGFSNNPDYDPSLSGGTGATLNDANGLNNGTLVNGPVFVFYESGEPEPAQVYELTATGGAFSITGGGSALSYNRFVSAAGVSISYSGSQANAVHNKLISAVGASFGAIGGAASLLKNTVMLTSGADISYSGAQAELTYSQSATVYEMIASGAEISFSGDDAVLKVSRLIQVAGAAFDYQGIAAGAFVNRSMLAGGGIISFELSGAELIKSYTLRADGGSYSLSGGLAQLNYSADVNMSIVDYSAVYCPYIAQADFEQSGSAQFADRQTSATFSN